MTARLVLPAPPPEGLQPMDLTRHLAGVADLVELCFASEMEEGGYSAVREMRFLSRLGPALPLLLLLDIEKRVFTHGYVWIEDGRVIGNLNMQPLEHSPRLWGIANVAVHPQHRRRGIAQQMMQAALDHLHSLGGDEAVLMVDDDNVAAVELYRRLGFAHTATHTSWMRSGRRAAPAHEPSIYDIRLRAASEGEAEYALAREARPEGLAWNRPLRAGDFHNSLWRRLQRTLNGEVEERWAVTPVDSHQLIGSLVIATGLPEGDRLTILVHPSFRGNLERPLLVRGLRRLGPRPWNVRIEHPTHDEAASTVLRDLGFTANRTLRWMRKVL
ncbi:MAG: GNAT family N-acetyltransferase [Anaerolineales bacterium]